MVIFFPLRSAYSLYGPQRVQESEGNYRVVRDFSRASVYLARGSHSVGTAQKQCSALLQKSGGTVPAHAMGLPGRLQTMVCGPAMDLTPQSLQQAVILQSKKPRLTPCPCQTHAPALQSGNGSDRAKTANRSELRGPGPSVACVSWREMCCSGNNCPPNLVLYGLRASGLFTGPAQV